MINAKQTILIKAKQSWLMQNNLDVYKVEIIFYPKLIPLSHKNRCSIIQKRI